MTNQELVLKIIEAVGGKDNIAGATNCMTRLRLTLKDNSKADIASLKTLEGVMAVVEGEQMQIVVGPGKAKKLADICFETHKLSKDVQTGDWQTNKANLKSGQKDNAFKRGLKLIANIFVPLIPALIVAGLCAGLSNLVGQIVAKSASSSAFLKVLQNLLALFGAGFNAYFAVFVGINAAKEFGATESLGGLIGGITIGAQINVIAGLIGWSADNVLNAVLTTGKGGIIGVIFAVWVLSKVEKFVRKSIPDVLDIVFTPIISIFVVGTITIFAIMPLAGILSDGIVWVLSKIISTGYVFVDIISGFILSALFLPMVLLGLHHGLIPLYTIQLESLGFVTLFPVLAMAGAGQVGAAIAIYFKAKKVKNVRMQKVVLGALPAGFLGVGEPLIYGVTLPLGKPFITAGLGAGFGGAMAMAFGVASVAWGPSGLVAAFLILPEKILLYLVSLVVAYVMGFIITYFFVKDSEVANV